jgi:hypothetical protein
MRCEMLRGARRRRPRIDSRLEAMVDKEKVHNGRVCTGIGGWMVVRFQKMDMTRACAVGVPGVRHRERRR